MNLQPIIPQPTNQFQYGYQINGTGLNQQQLSSTNRQSFFVSPTLGQVNGQEMDPAPSQTQSQQCLGTVEGTVRESTEEDKTKEVKRRLKIRGIPKDDCQY